jgi:cellobiose phosphorylase
LLGIRLEFGKIIIDPVIPFSMDGLTASLKMMGHTITFKYSVKKDCFHPKSIIVNGTPVMFEIEDNEYRKGGATISSARLLPLLNGSNNIIEVQL